MRRPARAAGLHGPSGGRADRGGHDLDSGGYPGARDLGAVHVRAIVLASRAGRLARLMRHLNLLQVLHVRPAPAARAHSRAAPTRAPEERRPPAHVPACLHCTAKR